MAVLAHVLARAWEGMDDVVRESRLITNSSGLPVVTVREGILLDVLKRADAPLPLSVLKSRGSVSLDPADAERLTRGLASHAAAAQLLAYSEWMTALNRECDHRSHGRDSLHGIARRLVAEHLGDAKGADDRDLIRALLARSALDAATKAQGWLTTRGLNAVWRDAAEVAELQARLDAVWALPRAEEPRARRRESTPRMQSRLIDEFLGECGFARKTNTVSARGHELWRQLLERESPAGFSAARGFGLTRRPRPVRPPLRTSDEDPREGSGPVGYFPLDRSIQIRLSRFVTGKAGEQPVAVTAPDAVRAMIDASPQPLGVSYSWARRVLEIGEGLLFYASPFYATSEPRTQELARLRGGQRTVASQWHFHFRRWAGVDRTFFENAHDYYMGRLWTRVMRQCLITAEPPDAVRVWELVYGAFVSLREDLPTLLRRRPRSQELSPHGISPAIPDILPVVEILDCLMAEGEDDRVRAFYGAVARLGDAAAPRELLEEWARFVAFWTAAMSRGADDLLGAAVTPLDVSFDDVRTWIAEHSDRGGRAPRSGIGEYEDAASEDAGDDEGWDA